ncbi:uncharacterized protein LOC129590017 isoform X2 [Paramacrobiotus metropolitanus]|uniref:uncharacterized protein LOC129590017 isoform X2 n=1 Tax=Paramacrobiotus metropolitanus TaxID=2943436 RepID=UPI002445AF8E|nr:uncharacterized protein LOC129590017 isoform X2 [Paramacrobiotus metropolitanus]
MSSKDLRCDHCTGAKSYTTKSNLNRHVKKHHPEFSVPKIAGKCQEPECQFVFYHLESLISHLCAFHNRVEFSVKEKTFQNFDEFVSWKADFEDLTASQFNHANGEKKTGAEKSLRMYSCFRNFKSTGDGSSKKERKFKCTAFIKVKTTSESVVASYCEQHYGHDVNADLHAQKIPERLRIDIGSRLALSADPRVIVRDVRKSAWERLEKEGVHSRALYITLQDVYNIRRELKLHWEPRKACEYQSMGLEAAYENTVPFQERNLLYLKNISQKCMQFPELPESYFIAVLQTPFQRAQFKRLNRKSLCIDATHGVCGQRGFKLITLMGIDAAERGFPVAHCIANHEDELTVSAFFKMLKEQILNFHAEWFLSDDAPAFFNAYQQVIGCNAKKILCTWHVRKNVNQWLDRHARSFTDAKKRFGNIMYARGISEAEAESAELIRLVSTDKKVYSYLSQYLERISEWSLPYRIGAAFSTSAFIESFHRVLKRVHLNAKTGLRIDELYGGLLDFIEQLEIKLFTDTVTASPSYRQQQIKRNHREAVKSISKYSFEKEAESRYVCKNLITFNEHVIILAECATRNCETVCTGCNVAICIHGFLCDCPSAVGGFRACNHVHLLCLSKKAQLQSSSLLKDSQQTADFFGFENVAQAGSDFLMSTLQSASTVPQSSGSKYTMQLQTLRDFLNDATDNKSPENLELVSKCAALIQKHRTKADLLSQISTAGIREAKARNSRLKRQPRRFKKSKKKTKQV